MWHELNRLIEKYEVQEDQVAIDLVNILKGHREDLGVDTPVDPISYEELMSYHLAFPPFFPNQKMFQSDDDFFVNAHQKYEHIDVTNIDSVIDRRRAFFLEEMAKKRERQVEVSYFDASGWTTLPAGGLSSLAPFKSHYTRKINYSRTSSYFGQSARKHNVAASYGAYIHIDFTQKYLCITSVGGAKLYLDNILKINANDYHYAQRTDCADVTEGVYKFDLEYYKLDQKSMLILTFGPTMDNLRVVPDRSWASVR